MKASQKVAPDVASFQIMQERLNQADALEGIWRGLEQMARGEGTPAGDVFAGFRVRHGIFNG